MNTRSHKKHLVLGLTGIGGLAAAGIALAAGGPQIAPNPIVFDHGARVKNVLIKNTGPAARYQLTIDQPGSAFKIIDPSNCGNVGPGRECKPRIGYTPSGASEDDATLQVRSRTGGSGANGSAQLIGRPSGGSGGGGGGSGSGPNCTMHVARNQKLVTGSTKNPYHVALLQNEDGTVSASASGKAKGKSISLNGASSAATAGNGVVLKLKLGKSSERRIRKELAAGRKPKMTLRGQCKGTDGATVETATLHFKSGKAKTLIADAKK
jgi:hypothetical protein